MKRNPRNPIFCVVPKSEPSHYQKRFPEQELGWYFPSPSSLMEGENEGPFGTYEEAVKAFERHVKYITEGSK